MGAISILVIIGVLIVFAVLCIYAIRFFNISFGTKLFQERLMTYYELRRLYDRKNVSDLHTTPVLYINIFSHRLQGDDEYSKQKVLKEFLDNSVKEAARSFGFLGAAHSDSGNYIIISSRDVRQISSFASSFASTDKLDNKLSRLVNLLDIHIGQYTPVNSSVSFEDAVNQARRASIYARNTGTRFAVGKYEILQNVYDSEKMKQNLESYIENNKFFTVLQPYVAGGTNRVIGAEILTRLNISVNMPTAMPGKFLSAVNSEQLYEKFDFYVFDKCCKWICCRKERISNLPPVSCNFNRISLSSIDFAERFTEKTEQYGIKPGELIIEINEEAKEFSMENMIRNINTLYDAGWEIYLDDFGTGFTTIENLKQMKISTVKLDRSFITDIDNEKDRQIFRGLIELAHSLGVKVLVEGVETETQKKFAEESGADCIQGFYFYKPISIEEYDKVLSERQ